MEEDRTRVREIFSCMVVTFIIQTLTIHENVAIIVLKLHPGSLLLTVNYMHPLHVETGWSLRAIIATSCRLTNQEPLFEDP